MKIAIAQTRIAFEKPADNLALAESWIAQASSAHCDGIVFPEMSFTGFSMHVSQIAPYSLEIRQKMVQLAQQYHIAIGYGWVSEEPDGKGKNHYTLLDSAGETVLDYVKIHPFSYGDEDQFYDSGDSIVSGTVCGIPVSALICYDLRFPEVFRLAARHSSLVLVPANWLERRSVHWQTLLRARAIENQVFVLGVNCVGTQQAYGFVGGSCLVDPEGNILADCGKEEALVYAEFTDDTAAYREAFPTYRDVKLPLYAKLYREETQK
ncbi:MAG: nitrilase-related carbon-nitrogen hydrolase [Ruminococcus sp.]